MLKSIAALLALAAVLLFPHNVFAQATASIAGTVVDASGAVLPGVTVEASSPALIEKARSVVTDGTGQFRIEQLRGGTYTVVFTLPGFSTVRREGVELTGSFAATINAELKLGSVEETITVTGDTPIVDIQSAQRQRVIDQELLNAIPTGRTPQVAAFMIPGVNLSNVDVGGTNIINTTGGALSIHGGRVDDTRLLIDGITIANTEGTGWSANVLPNMGSTQEVSVDYSSVTAESITGGLQINMIPKTGGNSYSGTLFATAVNSAFEGSNNDDDLVARGLRTPNSLKLQYDVNPGLGGPLREDKLWFYTSARFTRSSQLHRRSLPEPERERHHQVAVRAGHQQSRLLERGRTERQPATHVAGQRDQQGQFLLRPALALSVPHDGGPRGAGSGQRARVPDQRPDVGLVDGDAVEQAARRSALRRASRGICLHAKQPSGSAATADSCHRAGRSHPGAAVSRQRVYRVRRSRISARSASACRPSAALSYVTGSHSAKFGFYNVTAQRTSHVPDNAVAPDVPVQQRRAEPAHAARDAALSSGASEARPRHLRSRTSGP